MNKSLPWFLENPDPEIYLSDNYLVIDVETTSFNKGDPNDSNNSLLLSCYAGADTRIQVEWGNEYHARRIREHVERATFIVAHNAKFELGWLRRCGIDLDKVLIYDTMIGDYVLAGNRDWKLDLSSCSVRHGGQKKLDLVGQLIKGGVDPSEIPKTWLEKYCVQDVAITHELFLKQRQRLQEEGLLPSMYSRCIFTPVLTDIESVGMCLDPVQVDKKYQEIRKEYDQITKEMYEFTGGINAASPKQVAEFIYDRLGFSELKDRRGNAIRTAANGRKADKGTIEQLVPRNKKQREFLRLRKTEAELRSALTKYLTKFKECCDVDGGILYANFNQTITQTHRLSSSGKQYKVQFQNFNRAFKPLFKARKEGWHIGEIDGAQLEFRVAAHLGRDSVAKEAIESGFDVHSFTAQVLTDAGQPTDRQEAKAHTFKPLFGGQSGTDAEQQYYRAFRERYPGIAKTQQRWIDEVLSTKALTTETGLKFYWPDTKITRSGYVTNTPSICNYPVQSFATADIIPIGVTYLWHRMKANNMQSFIVNTIHDSAITELHPEEVELFSEIGELSLISDVYIYLEKVFGIKFTVSLGAEVIVTNNWGDKANVIYKKVC